MAGQLTSGKVLLVAAAVFGGLYLARDSAAGREAPAFSLPETYGGRVDLASYRGQPVVLVFWSASCGICRSELPLVSRLAPEFRNRGIAVAAIHIGGAGEARDYLRAHEISFTSLVDADGAVAGAYRVAGVPKLILVDAEGRIRRTRSGMAGESLLREWMRTARAPA
jgi:cytochrome c biogenesis protein CcmG, thiol:disulfide interchange protein DsbE